MTVHTYTRKSRTSLIRFGLTYESKPVTKTWHHMRFETRDEFVWLRKLFGEYVGYGVEKAIPTKRCGYKSTLHEHDTCHVITPSDKQSEFTSRLPVHMGLDLLYNQKDGIKVWERYATVIVRCHPVIQSFFLILEVYQSNYKLMKLLFNR